ncbi:MAG: DUF3455 domain-containing protein [Caulobacteraceae bacterium]
MSFSRFAACAAGVLACAPFGAHAAESTAIQAVGKGVQIYSCQPSGAGFAWKLQGPEATLSASDGRVIGRHFAGPSWQATDGSTIVGEPVVASASPDDGAIPWLVLHVKSTTGAGLFSNVTYVTRTLTHGGAAPATGCDAGRSGQETRAPYSATYTFFTQPNSQPR